MSRYTIGGSSQLFVRNNNNTVAGCFVGDNNPITPVSAPASFGMDVSFDAPLPMSMPNSYPKYSYPNDELEELKQRMKKLEAALLNQKPFGSDFYGPTPTSLSQPSKSLEYVWIKKLNKNAQLPQVMSDGAGGYDLFSTEQITIPPGERRMVSLGFQIEIAYGYVGIMKSRSSLAAKFATDTEAGVIDSDYRGEVKAVLANNSKIAFDISIGMRIAQIIFLKHEQPMIKEVAELSDSVRGSGAFGSTGFL